MNHLKYLIPLILAIAITLPATAADEKFADFWVKFKAAIQKDDKIAITDMTKFPYTEQDENKQGAIHQNMRHHI